MNEEDLFHRVLELPATERTAYLDAACAGDAALHQRLEALLQAHAQPGSFLQERAVTLPAEQSATSSMSEAAGTRIGVYKLIEPIGEGGMGSVWLAEQLEPVKRLVALKLIKEGLDSARVIARFEAERQALALMDHPNIAKVFDAGTTATGRPYFVMELVKGVAITKYCDEQRLTPRQRLELFIPVCQAVQHAHQKGIIHRDLKPSNVLIALYDGQPVPKVIDFGIAKATGDKLTDRTLHTGFGAIVGTLEYMSPEQATLNELDIDTRSDVYSLGVLLYELLTGTTPLDRQRLQEGALLEILRVIREEEPPRPSTRLSSSEALPTLSAQRQTEPARLTRLVRGELDWIIMKALEKNRQCRYDSAAGLGQDIARYLKEEPVEAGPPSAAYRLRKLLRRHRSAVLAAVVVFLTLAAGVLGTTIGMVRAWDAEQDALDAQGAAESRRDQVTRALAKAEKNEKAALFQTLRAETARYANQIDEAYRSWKNEMVRAASGILDQVDARFQQAWEYRYLRRLCRRKALPLAPKDTIACVVFSTSGRLLAAGDKLGTVTVWDTATGTVQQTLKLKGQPVCLAFSGDERRLAVGHRGDEHRLRVFQLAPLKEEYAIPVTWVRSVAFSPDSQQLATAHDDSVRLYDGRTGRELLMLGKASKGNQFNVAFSPDGKWIAGDGREPKLVNVWDATTGKLHFEAANQEMGSGSLQFSPDSRLLAVASGTYIQQWDLATKRPSNRIPISMYKEMATGSITYDPRGEMLFSLQYPRIRFYSALNAIGPHAFLPAHDVLQFAMSREGKVAVNDAEDGLQIWSYPRTPEEELTLGDDNCRSSCAAFHADGKHIVTLTKLNESSGKVVTWDASTGEVKHSFEAAPPLGELSADGSLFVSMHIDKGPHSRSIMKVWDTRTGKELHALGVEPRCDGGLAFSADGSRLVSAGQDGELRVWDLTAGRLQLRFVGHRVEPAVCAAFSPDGARIVSGNRKENMQVWDARTGQRLLSLPAPAVSKGCATFSPDGKELLFHDGTFARIIDAATGHEKLALAAQHATGVTYSRDGTRFFVGGALYDAVTGQELLPSMMRTHPSYPAHVSISPDGNRLLFSWTLFQGTLHSFLRAAQ